MIVFNFEIKIAQSVFLASTAFTPPPLSISKGNDNSALYTIRPYMAPKATLPNTCSAKEPSLQHPFSKLKLAYNMKV